jgi:hypothetical protein
MITRCYRVGLVLILGAGLGCVGGGSSSKSPYGAAAGSGGSSASGSGTATGGGAGKTSGASGGNGSMASGGAAAGSGGTSSAPGSKGSGGTAASSNGGAGGAAAGGSGGTSGGGAAGAGAMAMSFTAAAKESHFPLIDGATWTYHHTNPGKTAPWDEVDTVHATTYMGMPAFIFEDQEDAMGVQTHSTLVVKGTGVYRAYKENTVKGQTVFTVTYDPAFLRYDEAWTQMGQMVTLTDNWTQNCVQMSVAAKCAAGAKTPGMTTHVFTVLNGSVKLTVPAGTFDTIEIQRVDPMTKETKLLWFAAGVGKVREEVPATKAVEELTSYMIP